DLSDIKFMDSSGIGFLVATNNKVKQSGRGFYLYMPSPQVIKTLKLVNLFSFFEILRDEDDLVAVTPV
ncbi:MAG: STAS domain-containing protein, partial [Desulfovibrionales bacterium]